MLHTQLMMGAYARGLSFRPHRAVKVARLGVYRFTFYAQPLARGHGRALHSSEFFMLAFLGTRDQFMFFFKFISS